MPVPPFNKYYEDRRLTTKLEKYWKFVKTNKQFPSQRDINPKSISEIWSSCFIVEANNLSNKEDYTYKYIGRQIKEAYGKDLTGYKVKDVVAVEPVHLAKTYEKVLATKHPVIDEGEIDAPRSRKIKYRQILLPLGDDGVNINAILGGMSYKVFE